MQKRFLAVIIILALFCINVLAGTLNLDAKKDISQTDRQTIISKMNAMPASFILNQGQIADQKVKFALKGTSTTVHLTDDSMIFSMSAGKKEKSAVFKMTLAGANKTTAQGSQRQSGIVNYFLGNDSSKWHTNVPTYSQVNYKNVYCGIDMVVWGSRSKLKYEFHVAAGMNPKNIVIDYSGIKGLKIDKQGNLHIKTKGGEVIDYAPFAYQEIDGRQVKVDVSYKLIDKNSYSFKVGDYDKTRPLVIDPDLQWSTFFGAYDLIQKIAIDSSGNVFVVGYVGEPGVLYFPVTQGAYDTTFNGGEEAFRYDVFVAKIVNDGNSLAYSTFIGGSDDDLGQAIDIDDSGNAYITGYTESTDFPTTSGAFDRIHTDSSVDDAFIIKLNSSGSNLFYSTFFGQYTYGYSVKIDSNNDIYVSGGGGYFPTTSGAYDTRSGSGTVSCAFLCKLSPDGNGSADLLYSTGLGYNSCRRLSLELFNGDVFVTGDATTNFPTTTGAYCTTFSGYYDTIVAQISPDGNGSSDLVYSTYLGGDQDERGLGIALDEAGDVYITGFTPKGTNKDFPTTAGAYDKLFNGGYSDVYVAKLSLDGNGTSDLIYSTFLGGTSSDYAYDISVHNGKAIVTGQAKTNFPTTSSAYDPSYNSSGDAFISIFSEDGNDLIYSTFIGGSRDDYSYAAVVDADGNIYIAGHTGSPTFPTTSNAFDKSFNGQLGDFDAYILKLKPSCFNLTISGTVGTLDGVMMSGLPGNPVTSGGGAYSATVGYGWTGTVTPSKIGYTFNPASMSYSNVTEVQAGQNYTPIETTRTISGTVGTVDGVTMNGLPGSPMTSGGGTYTATVGYGWSGTVFPSKDGDLFSPGDITYSNVTADQTDQDYMPMVQIVHNMTSDEWYETIQEAIDDSNNGDGIEVFPGIYTENINFNGKKIHVVNACFNVEKTIIQPENPSEPVIVFENGETTTSGLNDLTIAGGGRGIVCEESSPYISGCIIRDNVCEGNGAGIAIYNASPGINSCTFINNSAGENGGGIYVESSGEGNACYPYIIYCRFISNQAGQYGGAICNKTQSGGYCNLQISNFCGFKDNWSELGGGAIYNEVSDFGNCEITMDTSKFIANFVLDSDANGGALCNNVNTEGTCTSTISSCEFRDNHCLENGGAIFNSSNTANLISTLEACSFKGNYIIMDEHTHIGGGGAIFNESTDFGNCDTTIDGCYFEDNNGWNYGGAICGYSYLSNYNPLTVNNSVFVDNFAYGPGGAIYDYDDDGYMGYEDYVTVNNCTFVNNEASYGGAFWVEKYSMGGSLLINNSILWQNQAIFNWDQIVSEGFANVNIRNSDIEGGPYSGTVNNGYCHGSFVNGGGNKYTNPCFVNVDDPNGQDDIMFTWDDGIRPAPGSPCIDAGNNSLIGGDGDIKGDSRIINDYVDMGAYEYRNIIFVNGSVSNSGTGSSWQSPYKYLEEAINLITPYSGGQIWVAGGQYRPQGESFNITKSGIEIYGGFDGTTFERYPKQHPTILSGDIGIEDEISDNCQNVVVMNSDVIIDGFVVEDGNIGIACPSYTSSTIQNCIIQDNNDGIVGYESSNQCITNNIIRNNAYNGISSILGYAWIEKNAIYGNNDGISMSNSLDIYNNTIVNNQDHGVLSLESATPFMANCILWANGEDLTYLGVSTCCIEDVAMNGGNNISYYPYFVDMANGDFRLKSYSPCIDRGDNNYYFNEPDFPCGRTDIGCFGNTPLATIKSADTDQDGLPDDWEMEFIGTLAQGPNDDNDTDNFTNLQEYQNGTNP